jgi:uncharacterized protein
MSEDLLKHLDHRPFPLPRGPWVMEQSWDDLLFAHWTVNPELISAQIPKELSLDTWGGQAFIGIVPFKMKGVKFRVAPPIPTATDFLELNVRTYVTYKDRPGIYFFSLDASSILAVIGARTGAGLKYFRANMHVEEKEGFLFYTSERIFGGEADLRIKYKPLSSQIYESEKGSIEEWLTERYCLFSQYIPENLIEIDIHHLKWPLQKAVAKIERNTMTLPLGINLADAPAYLHYVKHLKVLVWAPRIRKLFKE